MPRDAAKRMKPMRQQAWALIATASNTINRGVHPMNTRHDLDTVRVRGGERIARVLITELPAKRKRHAT